MYKQQEWYNGTKTLEALGSLAFSSLADRGSYDLGTKICQELLVKFAKLASTTAAAREVMDGHKPDMTYRTFERLMRDRSKPIEIVKKVSEESFMQAESGDGNLLSREDIKKRSDEVVTEGLAALEYKPPPPPAKKKFKFKK
ncbi:unnamed protein product [Phyllotreta striolata]|uniref:Uncharacterized protein n=1 Tax=Phyllotreta striolata TaxID=444603 RepID=A0A9N9TE31_PHYSR|nr:unnamed protein product [Phyllotreta striolata]